MEFKKPDLVVVKIGTNLLTRENGKLHREFIDRVAEQIAGVVRAGIKVVLVSSGAVAAGRGKVKTENGSLPKKQALAAIGQSILMGEYQRAFEEEGMFAGQILLQKHIFEREEARNNTRNAINELFAINAVSVVNENDSVSIEELQTMANDKLAAKTGNLMEADRLILLTDVDGLYDCNPTKNKEANLIEELTKNEIDNYTHCADGVGENGTGGMATKLEASQTFDGPVWIANGNLENVIPDIILKDENPGTLIY